MQILRLLLLIILVKISVAQQSVQMDAWPSTTGTGVYNLGYDYFIKILGDSVTHSGTLDSIGWVAEHTNAGSDYRYALYANTNNLPGALLDSCTRQQGVTDNEYAMAPAELNATLTAGTAYWICIKVDANRAWSVEDLGGADTTRMYQGAGLGWSSGWEDPAAGLTDGNNIVADIRLVITTLATGDKFKYEFYPIYKRFKPKNN